MRAASSAVRSSPARHTARQCSAASLRSLAGSGSSLATTRITSSASLRTGSSAGFSGSSCSTIQAARPLPWLPTSPRHAARRRPSSPPARQTPVQ